VKTVGQRDQVMKVAESSGKHKHARDGVALAHDMDAISTVGIWSTGRERGSLIRQMPTSRVTLIVTAGRANGHRTEYVLDHTAG
jgi:hypothetical protein